MGDNLVQIPRVAYFCMEYGLDPELPIYAGGLGILAGDYLKAARDAKVPMVGIGILWRQDYTTQLIGEDGRPYDVYPTYSYEQVKDTGVIVKIRVRGEEVSCKVRYVNQYGNVPLYLLDTNFPGSKHGWMTAKLYGGVAQDRIAQEIVLGVGGVRALRALGIEVDLYHFNEGHAVLAGVELIREKMQKNGMDFAKAWEATRREVVFTTHTPVEAGNEQHDHGLLQFMEAYNGLTYEQMKDLGGDPFNMTVAGLRLAYVANGVSRLHGETARQMWRGTSGAAPILSVTNGVHVETWQDQRLWEAYLWHRDLWQPHQEAKKELLEYIKNHTGITMRKDTLLVGFARRAAPYKRSELIFRNADTVEPYLREGKLQLIFSGKAHPNDTLGKDIVADLVRMDRKFGESVVFLENYNMQIAELLVRGCDVWLNNPRRPLEASGTSGMKAAMNGVLNLSVVDGWVAEGPQHGVSGWLLPEPPEDLVEEWRLDEHDLQALYKVLFEEVVPTFNHDRPRWVKMMRASIEMSHWQFSAARMLKEYYDRIYQYEGGWQDFFPKGHQQHAHPAPQMYQ